MLAPKYSVLFEAESLCSPELLVSFEHPLPSFFFLYPFHSNRSISGEVQSKSGDDAAFTSWLVNLKQKLAVFKDEAKLDLQHEQKSTESKGFQSMSESDDPGKSKKKKKDNPPEVVHLMFPKEPGNRRSQRALLLEKTRRFHLKHLLSRIAGRLVCSFRRGVF